MDTRTNAGGSDPLTGLLTRREFQAQAEQRIREVSPGLVLIWFDLDDFNLYNRRFGFTNGDKLLRDIAGLLSSTFEDGSVSRFSDDHFVVLTSWGESEERIERVQSDLRSIHQEASLRLRAGIYFPSEKDSVSLAYDRAKMASDNIRKDHSTGVCIYQDGLSERRTFSRRVVDVLDAAIERGDIRVVYQPIVRVLTGHICETEALTRWNDAKNGRLSPSDFIPILERYCDIHKLDLCILHQVCADLKGRMSRGLPVLPTSINLSRLDFELCDIFEEVERALETNGIPKNLLKIEITESVHGEDQNLLHLGIEKFRQNGYEVWMDDFGSGYSSLNVLKDYTFDTIKFDMKFLSGFSKSEKARYILGAGLSMAKQMGAQSLAEGVETEEQLGYLRRIGFEKAQGYLFGRPMSLDELFALPIPKEDLRDAPYYARLGRMELPSQGIMNRMGHAIADVRALYVVERTLDPALRGGRFAILAENDVSRERFAPADRGQINALLNRERGKMRRVLLSVVARLREPGEMEMFYAFAFGNCVQVCVSFLAANPRTGAEAYLVSHASVTRLPRNVDIYPLREGLREALGEIVELEDHL